MTSEDKQWLRNALSRIEDEARACRNEAISCGEDTKAFVLITQLAQLIREEIVK